MRKTAYIAGVAALLAVTAFGMTVHAEGEVIGAVGYSSLDTYVNNYPIPAYYMDGRQVICAEDLRDYGFTVEWNEDERALYITPDYSVTEISGIADVKREFWLQNRKAYDVIDTDIKVYLNGDEIESYNIGGQTMIKIRSLEGLGRCEYSADENYSKVFIDGLPVGEYAPLEVDYDKKLTIVLDAGHGKSSSLMSWDEFVDEWYYYKDGVWGEWRHWKNGTADIDCEGWGCNGDHTCWYPAGNGDRDTEPEITLNNALYAKYYLEQYGYNVRITRQSNDENPSFSKRVSYCYPDNDLSAEPDASCYVCIHSNAGGGRGTAYIAADGNYTQKWIKSNYVTESNRLGNYINNRIAAQTSLSKYGNGRINGEGYLILFNKCPVPAGYLEIGFFDSSDLDILLSGYNEIGMAIADGIHEYMGDF